jgi:hypothetical protein
MIVPLSITKEQAAALGPVFGTSEIQFRGDVYIENPQDNTLTFELGYSENQSLIDEFMDALETLITGMANTEFSEPNKVWVTGLIDLNELKIEFHEFSVEYPILEYHTEDIATDRPQWVSTYTFDRLLGDVLGQLSIPSKKVNLEKKTITL